MYIIYNSIIKRPWFCVVGSAASCTTFGQWYIWCVKINPPLPPPTFPGNQFCFPFKEIFLFLDVLSLQRFSPSDFSQKLPFNCQIFSRHIILTKMYPPAFGLRNLGGSCALAGGPALALPLGGLPCGSHRPSSRLLSKKVWVKLLYKLVCPSQSPSVSHSIRGVNILCLVSLRHFILKIKYKY